VAAPAVVAVVVGVIAAGIADGVSGLGSYAAVAGIVALFSLAVSAPTAALGRIWPPLVSVAVLVFIVLGIPASGGPASLGSFGPAFLRVLHPALPVGAGADAVRGAVYFSGYGTAAPAWVLAAWAAAGMIGLVLAVTLRRPSPVRLLPAVSRAPQSLPGPVAALANGQATAGKQVLVPAAAASHSGAPDRLEAAAGPAGPDDLASPVTARSVVVGFDNSGPARRALAWTARVAAAHPVELHIIYTDHVTTIDSDLSGFAHAEMTAARDEEASAVERAAADIIADAGVPYTFERRQGTPADAILAGASATAATSSEAGEPVIIVGRSSRAAHHVVGSVPVRLLHHSPYPVLAIP
jgi:nucleotide-binding universal stress UspA family protein